MNMPAQFLNQIGFNLNQGKRKKLTFMKNSPRALPRWMPRLLPLATALALAACSTQPAYQPPRLDVPARFKEAIDNRQITFVYLPVLKQPGKLPVHLGPPRQQQQTRGVHVQAMHGQRIGNAFLDAADQAVVHALASSGYRKQAGWLVDDQQVIIDIKEFKRLIRRRLVDDHDA